jgi:prephenate dehydrogenase
MTMNWKTVAIIGVGLIGGSIGMAIRARKVARRVVGIGRNAGSLATAKRRQAVDRVTTDIAQGVQDADLVIVCTPVDTIASISREAARHCRPGTMMTDVGSTKKAIVDQLDGNLGEVRFVGSHPIAGSEQAGPEHARADLFQGRVVVLTPTRRSAPGDVAALQRFWEDLGARTIHKSPAAHDRALASSSHLPHLVASVLAAATPSAYLPLVGTGWESTTRIAAGDSELWRQIIAHNRQNILQSLDRFIQRLSVMREALAADDQRTIQRILETGRQKRGAVGS